VQSILSTPGVAIISKTAPIEAIDKLLRELGTIPGDHTYGLAEKSATFTTDLLMNPLYVQLTKRLLTNTSCHLLRERTHSVDGHAPISLTVAHAAQPGSSGWVFAARTIAITPSTQRSARPISGLLMPRTTLLLKAVTFVCSLDQIYRTTLATRLTGTRRTSH
jgi:hypothetical protein